MPLEALSFSVILSHPGKKFIVKAKKRLNRAVFLERKGEPLKGKHQGKISSLESPQRVIDL
jgi:hypothetical protein